MKSPGFCFPIQGGPAVCFSFGHCCSRVTTDGGLSREFSVSEGLSLEHPFVGGYGFPYLLVLGVVLFKFLAGFDCSSPACDRIGVTIVQSFPGSRRFRKGPRGCRIAQDDR